MEFERVQNRGVRPTLKQKKLTHTHTPPNFEYKSEFKFRKDEIDFVQRKI